LTEFSGDTNSDEGRNLQKASQAIWWVQHTVRRNHRTGELEKALHLSQRETDEEESEEERIGRKGKRHTARQINQIWAREATKKAERQRQDDPKLRGHYLEAKLSNFRSWFFELHSVNSLRSDGL